MSGVRALASRLAFAVARSRPGGYLVGWTMTYLSGLLPVERLDETPLVIAFRHPRPAYRVHILIVPKRPIAGLMALTDDDGPLLLDVHAVARRLAARLGLERAGYRLIVNGGRYQDVPQLHFHLISEG
jgi:histidine triad (HIT) family protein